MRVKSSYMRCYCGEGNRHSYLHVAPTKVVLGAGPWAGRKTNPQTLTGLLLVLCQWGCASLQEPALYTTLRSADTTAVSRMPKILLRFLLWQVFSKEDNIVKTLFLTSEVKVTVIFRVACRSEWGKRTLQSSLQHFFLKNSTTISQLHVSPCGYRFQVQQHTEVCKSQQLIFSLTYQSHLVIYYDFAISVWSDPPLP